MSTYGLNVGSKEKRISEIFLNVDKDSAVNPDIVADICHLPFKDKCFKYTVCEHVLEHVFDLKSAIKELTRVTAHKIYVKTPYYLSPDAWADPEHVRAFSCMSFNPYWWKGAKKTTTELFKTEKCNMSEFENNKILQLKAIIEMEVENDEKETQDEQKGNRKSTSISKKAVEI